MNDSNNSPNFAFASSVAADVWHPKSDPKAYEWWYFDALSDDGRDSVVVIFLDNFIFSPRYNRNGASPGGSGPERSQLPAVAFFFYRDGKPLYRSINEFGPEEFRAGTDEPSCRIGESGFECRSAPYGSGYAVRVNVPLFRNRRIEASFEWLSVESDFRPESPADRASSHNWNLAVPRADVSGKIVIRDSKGAVAETVNFRGTGYHDHNLDQRWLPATVADWHWGRAHFTDATAVFYRYRETDSAETTTRLFTVFENELLEHECSFSESSCRRDIFGIRFPRQMRFESADGSRLEVEHRKTVDSSFFYLRFLADLTLTLPDGKARQANGITEYLAPAALRFRWLDRMIDMRIGRDGKSARLP